MANRCTSLCKYTKYGIEMKQCSPHSADSSTQIEPFIISVKRIQMAKPKPVPPYFLVVQASACLKD